MTWLAGGFERLATLVLRTSLEASAVFLAIASVQWLAGRALSPRWRCALWLLVALRLALPCLPESRLSVLQAAQWKPIAHAARFLGEKAAAGSQARKAAAAQQAPGGRTESAASPLLRWALVNGWLAGVALLAARTILAGRHVLRASRAAPEVADGPTRALLDECRLAMRVTRAVQLHELQDQRGPALAGTFRPRLLLPRGFCERHGPAEARLVFLHELAHLQRRDNAIGFLTTCVRILHWFNPLAWLTASRIQRERELACDALVLERLGGDGRRLYGQTILKILEDSSAPVTAGPGLLALLSDLGQLRDRIERIAKFKPESRPRAAFGLVLLLVAATTGLTRPPQGSVPALVEPSAAPARVFVSSIEDTSRLMLRRVAFRNAQASDVIAFLAGEVQDANGDMEGLKILDLVWPEEHTVSLDLRNVSLRDALDALTRQAGLIYSLNGRYLVVCPGGLAAAGTPIRAGAEIL